MTPRRRILTVYAGHTPDVVPYMLDLSHWFLHRHHLPWDLSTEYEGPLDPLIQYHRRVGVGFYLPINASFAAVDYGPQVEVTVTKAPDENSITWRYDTPLGTIQRTRVWEPQTYAWAVRDWPVKTETDLKVLAYALAHRTFAPRWDRYRAWLDSIAEQGVAYVPAGYSALGQLLNYWMGIEGTMYALTDWPDTFRAAVERINANNLRYIELLARSPAEIILLGDNFSSDVQPPHFFARWSRAYYAQAISHLHAAGKYVAVHIDGRLRGALKMIRAVGADCADAVTPTPMGDLTPSQCRDEAGPHFILSGGVSPDLWLPDTPLAAFTTAVRAWLDLRRRSPRLIANAGDQVPPGADEQRIEIMRDLVEQHGRF